MGSVESFPETSVAWSKVMVTSRESAIDSLIQRGATRGYVYQGRLVTNSGDT